ncbi:hypothetical protein PRZ48_005163 [Zasmidium cellare]|uniref:RING-type E3 ubiquitin transferase n=1 Tax=Zasmidium cellare TaxID=395010 RepID=A0ABR0ERY5_ZASCE|nr:hypothetical protein PRZ48_005163 [Zasmidium cellare]
MSNEPSRSNNNTTSTASSAYAGRPTAQDDLTWLDFLRTAGGTVRDDPRPQQLDRTDSAERKRRHTGSEPQRRTQPHPYQSYNRPSAPSASSQLGNSLETAIDLTTPPRPPQQRPPQPPTSRPAPSAVRTMDTRAHVWDVAPRESELRRPKWQPDHEASECPVCHNEFSIFYRRHHCRKCGRVVCATCSPHRITIPRQYIVQPPNPFYEDEGNPSSPVDINPALGGGEVVRVCNPCVPDPWTPSTLSPPSLNAATGSVNSDTFPCMWDGHEPEEYLRSERYLEWRRERRERARTLQNASVNRGNQNAQQPGTSSSHSASGSAQRRESTAGVQGRPSSNGWGLFPSAPSARVERTAGLSASAHRELVSQFDGRYQHTQNGGSSPMPINRPPPSLPNRPPPPPPGQAGPPTRAPPAVPQQRPRREVKEEDECPVCGIEMPPGEAVREAHIQDCIASRFSSTPSQRPRQQPRSRSAIANAIAAAAAPLQETASNAAEGSRPRATSYRPRGMALYRATEKDCTTEEGEPQECVICFEEFEEGDEMGRMECLCKFHRACIRQWWETKGQGSCPTHQLHD